MDYDKIGNFIQQKRKEKDLTQKELAKKLYLTDKAVSKWERGLGCPDVSTLEKLSSVLEVSILSILNGEDMGEEDVNNAVLKTINYSKDVVKSKTKNYISNAILVVIFSVISFLVYANIAHVIYLNQINKITVSYNNLDVVKEQLPKIKDNINLIKNSNLTYNDEDKEAIVDHLEKAYLDIFESELLKIETSKTFNLKEVYDIATSYELLGSISVVRLVNKYDPSLKIDATGYINKILLKMLAMDYLASKTHTASKYQTSFYSLTTNPSVTDSMILVSRIRSDSQDLYELTKYVLEVGVINE